MDVLSGGLTSFHRAQRPARSVAEAALVRISTICHAAMEVPPGLGAAFQRAQRPAVIVADTALMVVAAVSDTVMNMPSGSGASRHRADSDGGGAGRTDCPAVMPPAVMSVGGDRQCQQRQSHYAKQNLFDLHIR